MKSLIQLLSRLGLGPSGQEARAQTSELGAGGLRTGGLCTGGSPQDTTRRHGRGGSLAPLIMAVLVLTVPPVGVAFAGWSVLNHSTDTITVGQAECLVAPTKPGNRLRIKRVRITRSGTSDVTHRFSYAVTSDAPGDTESLSSCVQPTCKHLLTVEGIIEGELYDMNGLDLLLPPDARFYVHEDAHAATEHVTIEVFYTES